MYSGIETLDALVVTATSKGDLVAEIRFSRALHERLDAVSTLESLGHDTHELYEEHPFDAAARARAAKPRWTRWTEMIDEIPEDHIRVAPGVDWPSRPR